MKGDAAKFATGLLEVGGNPEVSFGQTNAELNSAFKNFVINHWLKPAAWLVLENIQVRK